MKGAERIYVYPEFTHSCTEKGKGDVEYIRVDLVDELAGALKEIIDRWDSPLWKDLPHTGTYIAKGRTALTKIKEET